MLQKCYVKITLGFSEDMVPESTMMTGIFCYRWHLYCLSNEGLTRGKSGHVCRTLETMGVLGL